MGKKPDHVSEITREKRAGGVAQVVECLPSKCEALTLTPSTTKKKKKIVSDSKKREEENEHGHLKKY
jgi:hypothetical protein